MKAFQFVIWALVFMSMAMNSAFALQRKERMSTVHNSKWSHLQGSDPDECKASILAENPDLKVHILPHDGKI
jgi:hypothetical protein